MCCHAATWQVDIDRWAMRPVFPLSRLPPSSGAACDNIDQAGTLSSLTAAAAALQRCGVRERPFVAAALAAELCSDYPRPRGLLFCVAMRQRAVVVLKLLPELAERTTASGTTTMTPTPLVVSERARARAPMRRARATRRARACVYAREVCALLGC